MLLDSYSEESPDYDDQLELRKDTLILETLLTKAERVIPPTVRRYNVVIVEHRKKLVPVLAASWAEAEERVREMWENGEVVIGQSDFTGIMISSGG
nr:DpnD/PcfM family protein [Acutalibacter sp. 1XD8-36]